MCDSPIQHIVHLYTPAVNVMRLRLPHDENRKPSAAEVKLFHALAELKQRCVKEGVPLVVSGGRLKSFNELAAKYGKPSYQRRFEVSSKWCGLCYRAADEYVEMGKMPCCGKWVCDTEDKYVEGYIAVLSFILSMRL